MSVMASQITSLTIVYSTVYSGTDHRKHQSSASLAFVGGIHRWPVNSPHKGPVTRKMFPFDDLIMWCLLLGCHGEGVISLAPMRCGSNLKTTFFKLIIQNSRLDTHCELNLRRMSQKLTDEKSTLVPVMHHLSKFWPRSLSPYTLLAKSNGRFFVLDFWKLSNRKNVFNCGDNKDR